MFRLYVIYEFFVNSSEYIVKSIHAVILCMMIVLGKLHKMYGMESLKCKDILRNMKFIGVV